MTNCSDENVEANFQFLGIAGIIFEALWMSTINDFIQKLSDFHVLSTNHVDIPEKRVANNAEQASWIVKKAWVFAQYSINHSRAHDIEKT
jgi:hypothetical protein